MLLYSWLSDLIGTWSAAANGKVRRRKSDRGTHVLSSAEALEHRVLLTGNSIVSISGGDIIYDSTGTATTITVSRTGDLSTNIAVMLSTSGVATLNGDYFLSSEVHVSSGPMYVNLNANESSVSFTVTARIDNTPEGSESETFSIAAGGGYTTLANGSSSTTVVITDSPGGGGGGGGTGSTPIVSIYSVDDISESSDGRTSFVITNTSTGSQSITIPISVTGRATNGVDYRLEYSDGSTFNASSMTLQPNKTYQIYVDPIGDSEYEYLPETVIISIGSSTSAYEVEGGTATVAIIDDDAPPESTINLSHPDPVSGSAFASENGDTGTVRFTRTGAGTSGLLKVFFNITGTATYGASKDYTLQNATKLAEGASPGWYAEIPDGSSYVDVIVAPNPDVDINDNNESVIFTLVAAPNTSKKYTLGTSSKTVTIANVAPLAVSFSAGGQQDLVAAEADLSGQPDSGKLKVQLNIPAPYADFKVQYTVGGTATPTSDYIALTGTVSFAKGQSVAYIDIVPYWDTQVETVDETVVVTLVSDGVTYTVSGAAAQTVTIDDAAASSVWFDSSSYSAAEEGVSGAAPVPASIVLKRSGNTAQQQAVNISWTGRATKGSDFTLNNDVIVFPQGSSQVTVVLTPIFDELIENETAILTLLAPNGSGYTIGSGSGKYSSTTVTIADAVRPSVTWTTIDTVAAESMVGGVPDSGVIKVTRTGADWRPLTVNYTLTGTAASSDYTLSFELPDHTPVLNWTSTTGTFPVGVSEVRIIVTPTPDALNESTETVGLSIGSGSYSVTNSFPSLINIANFQVPTVSLTATDTSAGEDTVESPPNPGEFRITRDGILNTALTMDYTIATGGSNATFGSTTTAGDYHILVEETGAILSALTGQITFPADRFNLTLKVIPHQDTLTESTESVSLTVSTSSNGSYNRGTSYQGTVQIADSIVKTVTISVPDPKAAEYGPNDLPDPGMFRFSRTGSTITATTVSFSFTGSSELNDLNAVGLATALNNGLGNSVVIPIGASFVDVRIDPNTDNLNAEADETVIFTVKNGTGYVVGSADSGTVTIANLPKQVVTLAVDNTTVNEPALGGSLPTRTFTLTRTGPAGQINDPLTVAYTLTGTATSGVDYTISGSATFLANATTTTIVITPQPDVDVEGNETVILKLIVEADISAYQLDPTPANRQKQVTIVDRTVTTVTVAATDATAAEWSSPSTPANNGQFTITRANGDLAAPIDVNFTLTGTATNGLDYAQIPVTVHFNANQTTATLNVLPYQDTFTTEGNETVVLTLIAGTGYSLGGTVAATVTIQDSATTPSASVAVSSDVTNQDNTCGCPGEYLKPGDGVTVGSTTLDYATGSVVVTPVLDSGVSNDEATLFPSMMGRDNPHPVITVSVTIPAGAPVPRYLDAQLKLGGIATSTTTFQMPAGAVAGATYQFALQTDASTLSTGQYDYTVNVVGRYDATVAGTYVSALGQASGSTPLINLRTSAYGRSWGLPGLAQLMPSTVDGQSGYLVFRGNGTAARFAGSSGTYTTPAGSYSTLTDGPAGYRTLTLQDGEQQQFDATTGRLTQTKDTLGRVTSYLYTGSGELSKVTDPDGRTFEYTYSGSTGKLTQIKDFSGRQWNYEYTGDQLTKLTTPESTAGAQRAAYSMTYDPTTNQLTGITAPDGISTTITYGADRRVQSVSSSDGQSYSLTSKETQALQTSSGTKTAVISSSVATTYTDAAGKVHTVVTDGFGRVIKETDPAGNVTTYTRNTNGQILTQTDPDPDGAGALAAPVTQFEYDTAGRLTKKTSPGGLVEQWTYNTSNTKRRDPLTYTDAANRVTTYTYDSVTGNLLTETDPLSRTTTYTYYTSGAKSGLLYQVSTPDPDGAGPRTIETTTFDYFDANRKVKTITAPNGTTTQYTYDNYGNVATQTDELGKVTTYSRDAYGHILKMTQPDPDGAGVLVAPEYNYTYDAAGRLKTTTNIDGVVTTYTYVVRNGEDLVSKMVTEYPLAGGGTKSLVENHTYNALGLVTSDTDVMGNKTTYEYDAVTAQLLIKVTQADPDGETGPLLSNVINYGYDTLGRQISMTEGVGTTLARTSTVTYSQQGWIATATNALGYVTSFTYDNVGNLLTATQADPDDTGILTALTTTYTYDAGNRLSTSTDPAGRTTSYSYYQDGNVDTITYPDPDGAGPLTAPTTRNIYDSVGNLVQSIDQMGLITRYEYTLTGLLNKVTSPSGLQSTTAYDALGRETQTVDEEGRTTTFTYNSFGQLASTTDYLSNVTTYVYDGLGRVQKVTYPDPDGAGSPGKPLRVEYTYNDDGSVASESTFEGTNVVATQVTSYVYDRMGNLITKTDPLGHATRYQYDLFGRTIAVIDPLLHSNSFAYDALDHVVSVTDATGYTTTKTYDGFGRLTTSTRPGIGTQKISYDTAGNILSTTDEEGRVTTYQYDNLDRVIAVTDAAGGQTQYGYDSNGLVTSIKDPNGYTIYQEYDSLGRLIRRGKDLVNNIQVESFNYSSSGLLINHTDTLGRTTVYTYEQGRLKRVLDPIEGLTEYAYDNLGRVIEKRERNYISGGVTVFGKISEYEYDFLGRLKSSYVPGQGTTTNVYDAADRLTSSDVEGKTTEYTYDAADRLIMLTDPMNRETDYTYDAANRLTSTTDALNHTQTIVYTAAGRVAESRDSLSGTTYFTYTASGNVATIKDPVNNLTTFEYDGANRVTKDTTTAGVRTYQYDAAGNLTSATDRTGRQRTFTYRFDFDGQGFYQQTHEFWWSGSTVVNDIESVYDIQGRLLSEGDQNSEYAYQYDSLSQVLRVQSDVRGKLTQSSVVENSYFYDAYGRQTHFDILQYGDLPPDTVGISVISFNRFAYNYDDTIASVMQFASTMNNSVTGKWVFFTYDTSGRITELLRRDLNISNFPYSVIRSTYGYNDNDETTSINHDFVRTPLSPPEVVTPISHYTWVYDSVGRIQSTSSPDGTTAYTYTNNDQLATADHSYQPDEAYTYDANGNRTGGGYTTGTFNRITSDGTYNYTYDAEGNRTSRTTIATGAYVSYTWDYRQRLTEVQFKTSSTGTLTKKISYTYDVNDQLIVKQLDATGDGTFEETERYVYVEGHLGAIMDDTDQVSHYYMFGPGVDQVFADETTLGNVLWSLEDNQGTIRDWVDMDWTSTSPTIADHLKYDSYGKITSQSNPSHDVRLAYTGREWDADVGLYYYRARWYDPQVGKFISEDPLGFVGGDANLQRYVGNSPVNATDPSGLYSSALADQSGKILRGIEEIDGYSWIGRQMFYSEYRQAMIDHPLLSPAEIYEYLGIPVTRIPAPSEAAANQPIGGIADAALSALANSVVRIPPAQPKPVPPTPPEPKPQPPAPVAEPECPGDPAGTSVSDVGPSPVVDALDSVAAGIAAPITFGWSNTIRQSLYGDIATRNQQGWLYNTGYATGVGISLYLGFGATRVVAGGSWAVSAASGYNVVGAVHGVGQSSYNLLTGKFHWTDTLGFLPVVGYGAGRVRAAIPARTGKVVLTDTIDAVADGARNRQVRVNDRLVTTGQLIDGDIHLSRTEIRYQAAQTGQSVRRILYDTAYHEAFHGFVEKVTKPFFKLFGIDDIYTASQDAHEWGRGWGLWYRSEEFAAEWYGRGRGFLREMTGWK